MTETERKAQIREARRQLDKTGYMLRNLEEEISLEEVGAEGPHGNFDGLADRIWKEKEAREALLLWLQYLEAQAPKKG